jgi:hypothetical protein
LELKLLKSNKYEMRQDTIRSTGDSITLATFTRLIGSNDDWMYCGTTTHYVDGTVELEDGELW